MDEVISKDQELSLTADEKLLKNYLEHVPHGSYHVSLFDDFMDRVPEIVRSKVLTFNDNKEYITFNARFEKPKHNIKGNRFPTTPQLCRKHGTTYGANLIVTVMHVNENKMVVNKKEINACKIPVMLRSKWCNLSQYTDEQLALAGEDPKDPLGYFIVKGKEMHVEMQEMLVTGRSILMKIKDNVVIRSSVETPRNGTALVELGLSKEKTIQQINIHLTSIKTEKKEKYKEYNVLYIYALYNIMDYNVILSIIGSFIPKDRRRICLTYLGSNIADFEANKGNIHSMIMDAIGESKKSFEEQEKRLAGILEKDIFPNMNRTVMNEGETEEDLQRQIADDKINALSIMIGRFLQYMAGFIPLDDRDSWSLKRGKGAGPMMEQLFRRAWSRVTGKAQGGLIMLTNMSKIFDVITKEFGTLMTDSFNDSFTDKWGVKNGQTKENVAVVINRESLIAAHASCSVVNVSRYRDTLISPRLVHGSSFGFICPITTPEGNNAGVVKSVTITVKMSPDAPNAHLIVCNLISQLPYIYKDHDITTYQDTMEKIIVNGRFMGWCNATEARIKLVEERRKQRIPEYASIVQFEDYLWIDTSPSRPIRPLLIVDSETQELIIDQKGLRDAPPDVLLANGAIEFLSPWEQEQAHIKIATKVEKIQERLEKIRKADKLNKDLIELLDIEENDEEIIRLEKEQEIAYENYEKLSKTQIYTHCEICPLDLLSISANMIQLANYNQAPRNTFQQAMTKQALGEQHSNYFNRMLNIKKLISPQAPLVETILYDELLGAQGLGNNVMVSFMAYPFTEEDAFGVSESFLQRGGFRRMKYVIKETTIKAREELAFPSLREKEDTSRYHAIFNGVKGDPHNGLPTIGSYVSPGDCVIGKTRLGEDGTVISDCTFMKIGEYGIVDDIQITSDNCVTVVKVRIRHTAIPQLGDKFAPRNAQKGTIGLIIKDKDLPFTETGLKPDFITNVHSIPSRMTMSYFIEMIAATYAAITGRKVNCSTFHPINIELWQNTIQEFGLDKHVKHKMRSGLTGHVMEAKITLAPVFFQSLKHHSADKIQVRGNGHVKIDTRQPHKGRSNGGAVRFGEMDRDAAISYGATGLLIERLMEVSDMYTTIACLQCGTFAITNPEGKYKPCPVCKAKGKENSLVRIDIPYIFRYLSNILAAAGIGIKPVIIKEEQFRKNVLDILENGYKGVDPTTIETAYDDTVEIEEDDENLDGYYDGFYDTYEDDREY